jgi:TonB family protein
MLAMIAAHWVRPPLGGGVEMKVHFRIHKDGRITGLRIVTSSGYNSFDLAGLRAVQSASPLPPLPRSYRRDSLGVNLIIR